MDAGPAADGAAVGATLGESLMTPTWVRTFAILALSVLVLSACATIPPGPTRPALIGAGRSQGQYEADDARCRQLAMAKVGDPAEAQKQQVAGAVVGTLIGAALGAAVGGAFGGRAPGIGAAIGGATGLGGGLSAGTAQAQRDTATLQQRWDGEYFGCMYAAGHQVPGVPAPASYTAPQPAYVPPPPPPAAAPSSPPVYQPSASPAAPVAASPPPPGGCKPTGKYVKTTQGIVPECE